MIEANNPEIDVNELMEKVREEVARRKSIFTSENNSLPVDNKKSILLNSIQNIEILLSNAEVKSQIRTEFPQKFSRFPFNISKPLQSFILKVYAFLFKEQRVVNLSLIQAFRESLSLNQQLIEQIKALQLQMKELSDRLTVSEQRITTTHNHYINNDSYLKNDLSQQKRLITLFLEEARQRLPEPFTQKQLQSFVNEEKHLLDAFYAAFEERFRGSREDILHRLKVYLPLIEEAKVGSQDSPILDVGCGRGEWLELLSESGYTTKGIDINKVVVEQCRTRGFDVIESDVITYLKSLPNASLGAVTGFHIIEHLTLE
ncbi:MAG TPA: methionine biosynthesis protein MetW, partial [Coleofasciculaceae cyanobacterium]